MATFGNWFIKNLPYITRWILYISIAFLTTLISGYDQAMNDMGKCAVPLADGVVDSTMKIWVSLFFVKFQVGLCEIKIISKILFQCSLQSLIAWRAFIDQSGSDKEIKKVTMTNENLYTLDSGQ